MEKLDVESLGFGPFMDVYENLLPNVRNVIINELDDRVWFETFYSPAIVKDTQDNILRS